MGFAPATIADWTEAKLEQFVKNVIQRSGLIPQAQDTASLVPQVLLSRSAIGSLPASLAFNLSRSVSSGVLMVWGSAYSSSVGTNGWNVAIDSGATLGSVALYMNEISSHKELVPIAVEVKGLGAGAHTLNLSAVGTAVTDGNDWITAILLG